MEPPRIPGRFTSRRQPADAARRWAACKWLDGGAGRITLTENTKGNWRGRVDLAAKHLAPGTYALSITTGPDYNGDGSPDGGHGDVICKVKVTKKQAETSCNERVDVYTPAPGEKLGAFANVALLPVGFPSVGTVLK